jgi:hypothetical protein
MIKAKTVPAAACDPTTDPRHMSATDSRQGPARPRGTRYCYRRGVTTAIGGLLDLSDRGGAYIFSEPRLLIRILAPPMALTASRTQRSGNGG